MYRGVSLYMYGSLLNPVVGPIYHKNILKHVSIFVTEATFPGVSHANTPKYWNWAYILREIPKYGYFLAKMTFKNG